MVAMIEIKQKDEGVTLIELMIVLVIAAFLLAGIYSLFITQHRSYSVQDQVVGVQQDARAALNIMARDIRMAGFVAGAGSGPAFSDGKRDNIAVEGLSSAVAIGNSTIGPDSIAVVLGTDRLGTVLSVTGSTGGSWVKLDRAVDDLSGFVSFDLQPGRVYEYQRSVVEDDEILVTNFPYGSKTVGGKAYKVQAITYSVTDDGILRRDGQPLAGDGTTTFVEDLQIAGQLPMVRINLTVRTAVPDAAVQDADAAAQFTQPALEDHTDPTTLQGPDGFRRRVYTTEVKMRNL